MTEWAPFLLLSVHSPVCREREFVFDNLLVRNQLIIVMIQWTGLAPWKLKFPFPGSFTSTFLGLSVYSPLLIVVYRGIALVRNNPPVGPFHSFTPKVLWRSQGGWRFHLSDVALYPSSPSRTSLSTRWSSSLSSKVNLPHAMNFRSLCGENLVTQHPRIWGQRNPCTSPSGCLVLPIFSENTILFKPCSCYPRGGGGLMVKL